MDFHSLEVLTALRIAKRWRALDSLRMPSGGRA
jgi:hypothetical protein